MRSLHPHENFCFGRTQNFKRGRGANFCARHFLGAIFFALGGDSSVSIRAPHCAIAFMVSFTLRCFRLRSRFGVVPANCFGKTVFRFVNLLTAARSKLMISDNGYRGWPPSKRMGIPESFARRCAVFMWQCHRCPSCSLSR
jgi:hypothetical protein